MKMSEDLKLDIKNDLNKSAKDTYYKLEIILDKLVNSSNITKADKELILTKTLYHLLKGHYSNKRRNLIKKGGLDNSIELDQTCDKIAKYKTLILNTNKIDDKVLILVKSLFNIDKFISSSGIENSIDYLSTKVEAESFLLKQVIAKEISMIDYKNINNYITMEFIKNSFNKENEKLSKSDSLKNKTKMNANTQIITKLNNLTDVLLSLYSEDIEIVNEYVNEILQIQSKRNK